MRQKMLKLFMVLKLAVSKPSLIIKFLDEIFENGFMAAWVKTKGKIGVLRKVAHEVNPLSLAEARRRLLDFPQCENPLVSIIVLYSDNLEALKRCLLSISINYPDVPFEVVVMSWSSIEATSSLQKTVRNVEVLTNKLNLEFCEFFNKITSTAKGEFILFLDAWTQVEPRCFDALLTQIKSDRSIGIIGPKLVFENGQLMEAGKVVWKDGSLSGYGGEEDPEIPEFNYVKDVDCISSRCFMIRKLLLEAIGGFDKRYLSADLEYHVADLAFSIRRQGYRVVYQPESIVLCFDREIASVGNMRIKEAWEDSEKFCKKWEEDLIRDHPSRGEDLFLARDRSWHRKHILVIDHCVPAFDQDAGSRTMWQYLNLLKDIGYQVTFIPDNFFPLEPYTSALEQKGIHVRYGREAQDSLNDWFIENGRYFDIAFLSRPDVSAKYVTTIRKYSQAKIIYYGHDLHHARLAKEFDLTGRSASLMEMEILKKLELNLFSEADLVLMLNQAEIDFINQYTGSFKARKMKAFFYHKIPLVDLRDFSELRSTALFVGGFRHRPNVDGIVWFARNVVPLIRKNLEKFHLVVVGSEAPPSVMDLSNLPGIEVRGYVDELTLKQLYRESMLAVVPLRYGAGVKGKTVEAMCHGLPVVSTAVGAEGLDEVEDFIVVEDSPEKMAESILSILSCQETWEYRTKRSIEYALANFSYDIVREEFESLLAEITSTSKSIHLGMKIER